MTMLALWGFWALFTAVVMLVDRNMRPAEDFTPSPAGYFVLAAVSPFMVLPVYFFAARRNSTRGYRALAALAGLAFTLPCMSVASFHTIVLMTLLSHV